MDTTVPAEKPRLHPLLAIAAVAIILFSLVGIAAMTGWLPMGKPAPAEPVAVAAPPVAATAAAPAEAATPPAQNAAEAPKPVAAEAAPKVVAQAQPKPQPVAKPAAPKPAPVAPVEAAAPAPVAPAPAVAPPPPPPVAVCGNCGVIDHIRPITQQGEGTGLGAIAGGVVGAIVGNQIGGGTGRKIATVAGAAGGAYAGHQIEKSQRKSTHYEVVVRMDDGTSRSVMMNMMPGWQVGERVRIENGTITRD